MLKNRLLTIFILGIMLFTLSSANAEDKKVLETKKVGDSKYTLYTEKTKVSTRYYIDFETENGVETWSSNEDQKLDSFIICVNFLNNIDEFAMQTANKYDSKKWTKVLLRRPFSEDEDYSNTNLEVYAKKDAVIHINCDSEDPTCGRTVNYALISDPVMVDSLLGEKVFGMEKEKFFQKFGGKKSYDVIKVANFGFTLTESDNVLSMDFYFDKGKVNAVGGKVDCFYKGLPHFEDFKHFVSSNIPEGLFTKGACLEDNVNVLDKPVNGASKTKLSKNKIIYISEFKKVDKDTWVKIMTPEGIEGWVNGKSVTPDAHCFSAFSRVGATFDYITQMPLRLGNPTKVNEKRYIGSYMLKDQFWDGIEYQMAYDTGTFDDEPDEPEEKDEEVEEVEDEEEEDDEEPEDEGTVQRPLSEDIFVKLTVTKPVVDFLGFKVGSNMNDLKALAAKLAEIKWHPYDDNVKELIDLEERAGKDWEKPFEMVFKDDGVYRWNDLRGTYTKGIRITMKKGKAVSIEFIGPDTAN